jgi:hypothetical protein
MSTRNGWEAVTSVFPSPGFEI